MGALLDHQIRRLSQTAFFSFKNLQYFAAFNGVLSALCFFLSMVSSSFLPPPRPWWDAERTVKHYRDHEKGIQGGAALFMISGLFYLPFTALISYQIRRIPNLPYYVSALQLAGGAGSVFGFMMPGVFLGTAAFRLERPPEITEMLNDLFWLSVAMPWPSFFVQNLAFVYAILYDDRPKPLIPRVMAFVNFFCPLLYVPTIVVHCFRSGPLAWNGAWTFWVAGVAFCAELTLDTQCLLGLVRAQYAEGANDTEMAEEPRVESYPTTSEDTGSGDGK